MQYDTFIARFDDRGSTGLRDLGLDPKQVDRITMKAVSPTADFASTIRI